MTAGCDQVRDSTRRFTATGSGSHGLRFVKASISWSPGSAWNPPARDMSRLVANPTRPRRGYAVAWICFIHHCIQYASTKSRRFIPALGLDALRISQFRRCWNYAIGSAALLAMSCSFANAERFSVKCAQAGYFYVSFDTDSGEVVEETLSGRTLGGRIDKIDGERIDFHVAIPGIPDMELVWDGQEKKLTTVPIPGDSSRDRSVFECAHTELRSMLSKYDKMP
jgi:hypothetical protein